MLDESSFEPVTFENMGVLERYLAQYPRFRHSEYSPVTVLSWEHYSPCYFAEYRGHLVIDCVYEGVHSLHAPIGPGGDDVFRELAAYAESNGMGFDIYDRRSLETFRRIRPDAAVEPMRGYFEYCWRAGTLADLKGKAYANIRGQINRFEKQFGTYAVEPIVPDTLDEVRDVVRRWGNSKILSKDSAVPDELTAVGISLNHFNRLHLEGLMIRIDGNIVGVSVWENRRDAMVPVHYEKGLAVEYDGIFKIINRETARYLRNRYRCINREGDMDEPGLRESKLRYHPEFFLKAYHVAPDAFG